MEHRHSKRRSTRDSSSRPSSSLGAGLSPSGSSTPDEHVSDPAFERTLFGSSGLEGWLDLLESDDYEFEAIDNTHMGTEDEKKEAEEILKNMFMEYTTLSDMDTDTA